MRIVIIEDEKLTADDLERTLLSYNENITVIQKIKSVHDGQLFFQSDPEVDIIISDIQLGDGLSFDIFEAIKINIPIIYCTAYDNYTLKAFKTLGIDYILKPFDKEEVFKALQKYELLTKKEELGSDSSIIISQLKQQLTPAPSSIIIRKSDKVFPVSINKIVLFYIENDIVYVLLDDSKKYSYNKNLNTLEVEFKHQFFRVNRQYLINRSFVKEAEFYFNRKLKITLTVNFPHDIIVGKTKSTEFLNWLADS